MPTIRFSLSPTATIRLAFVLSTIGASWMLSVRGSRRCVLGSIASANMVISRRGRICTTHCLVIRAAVEDGAEPGIAAVHLVMSSKKFGEKVLSIPDRLKWEVLGTSRDMS